MEFFCYETSCGYVKDPVDPQKLFSLFQEPIKCKTPGNPENGHSSGETYTVGAEVTFSCEEGYQLVGAARITCLESGEWSHLIPYCEGMLSKFLMFMVYSSARKSGWRNAKCGPNIFYI